MENKIIEIIENISGYNNLKNNIDIDLIENEIIDSLGFIELIAMLEDEFNVEIQPTQVSSDTWRSVGSITKLIISLKK
ncbi:MAG: hypothetical protein IKL55_07215 [Clostridia bacterium]|nr:hypothetical protein [Clostridia bacterium]